MQAHRGLKLWATSARADGIVVGEAKRPVELVVFDDESKSARVRRNTEKLLEEGAEILFSPYGSAASIAYVIIAAPRDHPLTSSILVLTSVDADLPSRSGCRSGDAGDPGRRRDCR